MNIFNSKKEKIGILICIASAIIFGLYPAAARFVYQDGGNITLVILVTTFCRFFALYSVSLIKKDKIFVNFKTSKISIYAGFFQALSVIGILAGAYYLPSAVVMIIVFTFSLMTLLFSAFRREIKLNIINISFTVLALLGLVLVLDVFEKEASYPLIGIGLAFMAAFSTFIRIYIYSKQGQSRSPVAVGAESFFVAIILLLGLLFWELPILPTSNLGVIMLVAASVSLAIGSFGMFYGTAYLGAYKFSMIMKLEPIFTAIFGILIVNDVLSFYQYCGIALVLSSIVIIQLFDKQK